MSDVREDLATTEENVADLDQDVNFLFDEQVIQDEKLLDLEQETDTINSQLFIIDDNLESKITYALERSCKKTETNKILHLIANQD